MSIDMKGTQMREKVQITADSYFSPPKPDVPVVFTGIPVH
jgi:hypothetical protein